MEQSAEAVLERIRAQIDEKLNALANERDDDTIQELQVLVSLESRISNDVEPPAAANWF